MIFTGIFIRITVYRRSVFSKK